MPAKRCTDQSRPAVFPLCIHISPFIQQGCDNVGVPGTSGAYQRGPPIIGFRIDLRTMPQQELDHLVLTFVPR